MDIQCNFFFIFFYFFQFLKITKGTLRENICFGSEYKKEKFDEVARVCRLVTDFELMPSGEMTTIGENGVNLSGGQKQR